MEGIGGWRFNGVSIMNLNSRVEMETGGFTDGINIPLQYVLRGLAVTVSETCKTLVGCDFNRCVSRGI